MNRSSKKAQTKRRKKIQAVTRREHAWLARITRFIADTERENEELRKRLGLKP